LFRSLSPSPSPSHPLPLLSSLLRDPPHTQRGIQPQRHGATLCPSHGRRPSFDLPGLRCSRGTATKPPRATGSDLPPEPPVPALTTLHPVPPADIKKKQKSSASPGSSIPQKYYTASKAVFDITPTSNRARPASLPTLRRGPETAARTALRARSTQAPQGSSLSISTHRTHHRHPHRHSPQEVPTRPMLRDHIPPRHVYPPGVTEPAQGADSKPPPRPDLLT